MKTLLTSGCTNQRGAGHSGLTREPDFWRIPIIQEWLRCAEKTPELFSRMINGLSDIEWQTLLLQQERYKENNHE
ncbi:hypothetical protein [Klebsiella michiganensis]|uniref:hypothetical protein n=1 Tax=Klebsiella michiganensis TaxID=1134687 RepID=UPI00123B46E0|nr:hypothetical protein [Klebsiella michiganensis]QET51540.1 hypothetical protein FOB55_27495 [Klebsiella michiganensis]